MRSEEEKEKQAVYHRNWTIENRDKRRAANKRWRSSQRYWLKELKHTLACETCGESHIACLEFHHENPNIKEGSIGTKIGQWGKKRILDEISKCKILCANCHRKIHFNS